MPLNDCTNRLYIFEVYKLSKNNIVDWFNDRRKVCFSKHFSQVYFNVPPDAKKWYIVGTAFKRIFTAFSHLLQRRVHP